MKPATNQKPNSVAQELMQMTAVIMRKAIPALGIVDADDGPFFCYVVHSLLEIVEAWVENGQKDDELMDLNLKWKSRTWNTQMSMSRGDPTGMMQGCSPDDSNPRVIKFSLKARSPTEVAQSKPRRRMTSAMKKKRDQAEEMKEFDVNAPSTSTQH